MIDLAVGIYVLCAAASLTAAVLLLRQYRTSRTALLLWSCIGFFGLALNNLLLFIDLGLLTGTDMSLPRTAVGTAAMLTLAYGLIWETER